MQCLGHHKEHVLRSDGAFGLTVKSHAFRRPHISCRNSEVGKSLSASLKQTDGAGLAEIDNVGDR